MYKRNSNVILGIRLRFGFYHQISMRSDWEKDRRNGSLGYRLCYTKV